MSCIRCVHDNAECSGRASDDLKSSGDEQHTEGHNLLHELLSVQEQLNSLCNTPLRRAMAVAAYSEDEIGIMYSLFKTSSMSLLSDLCKWESIFEMDAFFPYSAMAIVSVVAMTTTVVSTQKQRSREFFINQIWEHSREESTLDIFFALAVICAYRLPIAQLGISHIFAFYGTMASLRDLTDKQTNTVRSIYIYVTVPYGFLDSFRPMRRLLQADCVLPDNMSVASVLLYSYHEFESGMKAITYAETVSEAIEVYEKLMARLHQALAQSHESIGAISWLYFMARLKLMKLIAVRVCVSWPPQSLEKRYLHFLEELVAKANEMGYTVAHELRNHAFSSVFPTFSIFLVEDILINLFALRFVSFASRIDVDVKTEDFLNLIESQWVQLAQRSSTACQGFISLLTARILSGVKIGVFNKSSGVVGGPGKLPAFEIYVQMPEMHTLQLVGSCTSSEAHDILCSVFSNAGSNDSASNLNSRTSFTEDGRYFLREMLRAYLG